MQHIVLSLYLPHIHTIITTMAESKITYKKPSPDDMQHMYNKLLANFFEQSKKLYDLPDSELVIESKKIFGSGLSIRDKSMIKFMTAYLTDPDSLDTNEKYQDFITWDNHYGMDLSIWKRKEKENKIIYDKLWELLQKDINIQSIFAQYEFHLITELTTNGFVSSHSQFMKSINKEDMKIFIFLYMYRDSSTRGKK